MLDRQFVTIIICCIPTLNCGWIPKLKRFVCLVPEQEPVFELIPEGTGSRAGSRPGSTNLLSFGLRSGMEREHTQRLF